MALTTTPAGELGAPLPPFSLRGVDGKTYSDQSFKNAPALVIVFMCNHCPYVIAVQSRINALAKEYMDRGVALIGINSNDSVRYPDDDFEAMKKRAEEQGYAFPYLWDESQKTAKDFGAVCTPDFFVYDSRQQLRYRGRLDDSWKDESLVKQRDLAQALDGLLAGRALSSDQKPSMGCSIKWK